VLKTERTSAGSDDFAPVRDLSDNSELINSELEKQDRENESLVKQELERQEKKTAAGSSDVSGPGEDSFAGQVFDMHQEMIDLLRKNEKEGDED
jgi:hypothetical protein